MPCSRTWRRSDLELIAASLERWKIAASPAGFRKVVAGKTALELPGKRPTTLEIGAMSK